MPIVPALLLAVAAPLPAPPPLLLTGGLVRRDARTAPRAEALVLERGRIAFVGPEEEARKRAPGAREVKLNGAVVVPGLADAHGHLLGLGQSREALDLHGLSIEEIAARVAERARALHPGDWVEGRGWDQNRWKGGAFPGLEPLDAAAPKNPVFLARVDGHAAWVNGAALRAAGIDPAAPSPADPSGGRFLRDAAGRPTGVVVDNAVDIVRKAIPAPGEAAIERRFLAAMRSCAANGLTSVGDASSYGPTEIGVLSKLAREGRLPIRVYATVGVGPEALAFLEKPPVSEGRLTVRAVKIYADGALGSRGAALLSPYSDDPSTSGLLVTPPDEVARLVARALAAGWQPWIHAIGDRGNRIALDAIAAGLPKARLADARPRVEHAQVIAPEDLPRFAKLGAIASVQPTHATSDMPWAPARLGPARMAGAYAWASLLRSGAHVAGGSDFPIESEDPRLGLEAAAARADAKERLTNAEALALFTEGVAWAEFAEKSRGRIAEGYAADLTVLDRDPVAVPASELSKLQVRMTVVGGEIVFSSSGGRSPSRG